MNQEEFEREIERREELIAGADARNAELEAQCAAMRAEVERDLKLCDHYCPDEECTACASRRQALASGGGKALLERLEGTEKARDANWKLAMEHRERAEWLRQNLDAAFDMLKGMARQGVELNAQLAEARAVLREVEWCADNACPVCFLYEDSTDGHGRGPGHAPDCRLKKALGE